MQDLNKPYKKMINRFHIMIIIGIMLALYAGILLLLGIITSGIAAFIGIVGIGLISTSGRLLKR